MASPQMKAKNTTQSVNTPTLFLAIRRVCIFRLESPGGVDGVGRGEWSVLCTVLWSNSPFFSRVSWWQCSVEWLMVEEIN